MSCRGRLTLTYYISLEVDKWLSQQSNMALPWHNVVIQLHDSLAIYGVVRSVSSDLKALCKSVIIIIRIVARLLNIY